MRALLKTPRSTTISRVLLASAALVAFSGCQESTDSDASQEMAWAKAALERNPNLEVVAADVQAGVFTVRDRNTDEVQAVKLGELAAAPIGQLTAPAPMTAAEVPVEPVAGVDASPPGAAVPAVPAPTAEAAPAIEPDEAPATAAAGKQYTIERVDGHVKVSGPGLSIVSGGSAPPVSAKDAPGQRTVDPIICEGRRMMHLDDRDIYVEGDAITVRGGCELFITNSRIVAAGTGVVVRDGVVHIANSYVEGANASFDAAADARLYLRGSTFQGVSRRDSRAMIQDQGGNQLR